MSNLELLNTARVHAKNMDTMLSIKIPYTQPETKDRAMVIEALTEAQAVTCALRTLEQQLLGLRPKIGD